MIPPDRNRSLQECHEIIMKLGNLKYPNQIMREPKSNEWKTKNGRILKIKEMEDFHLINTINMLHRKAKYFLKQDQEEMSMSFPDFQGEMAQYYAEKEWDNMMSATPEEYLEQIPQYNNLYAEAEKRNLIDKIKPIDNN